jgi:hypothetical protein
VPLTTLIRLTTSCPFDLGARVRQWIFFGVLGVQDGAGPAGAGDDSDDTGDSDGPPDELAPPPWRGAGRRGPAARHPADHPLYLPAARGWCTAGTAFGPPEPAGGGGGGGPGGPDAPGLVSRGRLVVEIQLDTGGGGGGDDGGCGILSVRPAPDAGGAGGASGTAGGTGGVIVRAAGGAGVGLAASTSAAGKPAAAAAAAAAGWEYVMEGVPLPAAPAFLLHRWRNRVAVRPVPPG